MTQFNSWGPLYWNFLHSVAARYPDNPSNEEKIGMSQFLNVLPQLIPCKTCREHTIAFFNANQHNLGEFLSSKTSLFFLFWAFHNNVNKRLGKKMMPLQEAKIIYNVVD